MKIEIELQDFLEIACQSLGYCSLVNAPAIAQEISNKDPTSSIAHIEWSTPTHPTLWSSANWVDECIRKKKIDNTLTEFRNKPKPAQTDLTKQDKLDLLATLLKQV